MDMSMMDAYLAAPLQLDKICRACLSEKGDANMKPLFGACLSDMLTSFAPQIQVNEHDGLPSKMCVQCILQCSRAYTFKQLVEKSETILRNFISPEFQNRLCRNISNMPGVDPQTITVDDLSSIVITSDLPTEFVSVNYDEEVSQYYAIENDDEIKPTLTVSDLIIEPTTSQITNQTTASGDLDSPDSEIEETVVAKFTCRKCPASFERNVDLKVHMLTDHPNIRNVDREFGFNCKVCDKSFAEAKILKRHAKIHLTKKPHKCDQCDMAFAESSNLSKHKKKHTGELRNIKGKPHLCSVCGRGFKWASSLSKHTKYHTGHKLHTCTVCDKQYVEARSLTIHMRLHTGERPYPCPFCDKAFTQVCNLEKHLRIHTGEKPYLCPICGKGFTQSGYVSVHMRTHTGEKPHVCQTCGKGFAGSNTLTTHQRIHTGEKPYACKECGKRFNRQETMVIHARSHTGDKPYACTLCTKAFMSSSHLSAHVRTHSGDRPHQCKLCQKKFTAASSLKTHLRTVHSVSDDTGKTTCKECNGVFYNDNDLQTHFANDHSEVAEEDPLKLPGELPKVETVEISDLLTGQTIQTVRVQTGITRTY